MTSLVLGRQWLPAGSGAFLRRRLTEAAGAGLVALAVLLAVALATYAESDPSPNNATGAAARNVLGIPGAAVADIALQSLGLAALLPVAVLAAWGFRLVRSHRLPLWWLRLATLPVAIVAAATALAFLQAPDGWPRPFAVGLGGIAGRLCLTWILAPLQGVGIGATGLAAIAGACASAALVFLLAVTWIEWRAAARGMRQAAGSVSGTAGAMGRRLAAIGRRLRDPAQRRAAEKAIRRRERREPGLGAAAPDDPATRQEAPPRPAPRDLVESGPRETPAPRARRQSRKQAALDLGDAASDMPSLDLLRLPRPEDRIASVDEDALAQNARLLETVLDDFGVQGRIVKVRPGPVVTLYEFEPAPGTKAARVIGLADDIARSMSAISVRVAVVPGRNVIGIELPNATRETVLLRELLSDRSADLGPQALSLALGKDIGGAPIVADLARMPHLLIAGTTGSGKSVAINTMILSLLYRHSPASCRFIMIDPKMIELSVYDGIPHLLSPVVTDPKKAVVALKWVVREMENRYRAMSKLGVRNIAGYNARLADARRKGESLTRKVQTGFDAEGKPVFEEQPLDLTPLPFIVVIVDEMADLMLVAGKDVEWAVQRLAQMARAAGIHIVMATQRPSVDVITGTIKANFPTRISFQVTSKIDSRTILGEQGAEQLLGQGDMLYMAGGGRITRVHGPFVSDREVEAVVAHLKAQGDPAYVEEVTEEVEDAGGIPGLTAPPSAGGGEGGEADAMYDQAVALVARERKCSTSFVQRHFQIGYNRAARIVERMEKEGVVGPANHVGKREVIAPKGDYAG
ncbi:MAG: DNA translocase FtsK 4TM domain-containing protein [Rhodospirillales bacterium]